MSEHQYYVYIMASRSHTLYIGFTSDIGVRVRQHKAGTYEGFSKTYHCTRLVYLERFAFANNGIAREKQLKRWSRAKKLALIESQNPTWLDLSEDWGKPIPLFREPAAPTAN
jgi:putative endonuclease